MDDFHGVPPPTPYLNHFPKFVYGSPEQNLYCDWLGNGERYRFGFNRQIMTIVMSFHSASHSIPISTPSLKSESCVEKSSMVHRSLCRPIAYLLVKYVKLKSNKRVLFERAIFIPQAGGRATKLQSAVVLSLRLLSYRSAEF